jgi:hypothetical protein
MRHENLSSFFQAKKTSKIKLKNIIICKVLFSLCLRAFVAKFINNPGYQHFFTSIILPLNFYDN